MNVRSASAVLEEAPAPRLIDIHIGKRLAGRREALGLSREVLARKASLGESVIGDFETGRARMGSCDLLAISEILDVGLGYYYAG